MLSDHITKHATGSLEKEEAWRKSCLTLGSHHGACRTCHYSSPGTYKTQELPCGIRVAGNPWPVKIAINITSSGWPQGGRFPGALKGQGLCDKSPWHLIFPCCPACRTTLVATRFWVVMICPIIKCLTVLRVFFYFVWFVFIHHNFQFYFELCTYCNILDIYLS